MDSSTKAAVSQNNHVEATTVGNEGEYSIHEISVEDDYLIVRSPGEVVEEMREEVEMKTEEVEGRTEREVKERTDGSEGSIEDGPIAPDSPKSAHDNKSSSSPDSVGQGLEWQSRADMSVRMERLQAATHNGSVYVGGGFTGNTNTEMIVYRYDPTFNTWSELPAAPVRWFGMTEFKGQLVLVGGKDAKSLSLKLTNWITVWDENNWTHPYPTMSTVRLQPVVFSHSHLLVVAGGRKGVLDFHVEVFNEVTMHWSQASPLPSPCLPLTSLVHNGKWYLLEEGTVPVIHSCVLSHYLKGYLGEVEGSAYGPPDAKIVREGEEVVEDQGMEGENGEVTFGSKDAGRNGEVDTSKFSPDSATTQASVKPMKEPPLWTHSMALPSLSISRMVSIGHHIVGFSSKEGSHDTKVQVQQYLPDSEEWVGVGKLPVVARSAASIRLVRGQLMLFGGDVDGLHYSNKVYHVTLGSTEAPRKKAIFVA